MKMDMENDEKRCQTEIFPRFQKMLALYLKSDNACMNAHVGKYE